MECKECDEEITTQEQPKLDAVMQHYSEQHGYFSTADT